MNCFSTWKWTVLWDECFFYSTEFWLSYIDDSHTNLFVTLMTQFVEIFNHRDCAIKWAEQSLSIIAGFNYSDRLLKTSCSQNINNYLHEWERTYTECKKLKLSEIDENQSLFDFLNAVSGIATSFAEYWLINIKKQQDKDETLPDLYKIV